MTTESLSHPSCQRQPLQEGCSKLRGWDMVSSIGNHPRAAFPASGLQEPV